MTRATRSVAAERAAGAPSLLSLDQPLLVLVAAHLSLRELLQFGMVRHLVRLLVCVKLISSENLMAQWGDDSRPGPNINIAAVELRGFASTHEGRHHRAA